MSREEIQKLLGGYATGTLTSAECEALFAAALEDQELFEALAREEPLRELLRDPIAKTRLLAALENKAKPGYRRWLRPAVWAIPAVGLAAIVAVFVVQRQETRPLTIAQLRPLPRIGQVEPVPSALPQNLEKKELPLMARAIKAIPADSLKAREAAIEPQPKDVPAQAQTLALADQALAPPESKPVPPPAPAVPPPPPVNPPSAAQQVAVEAAPAQIGQQGQAGSLRLGTAAEALQAGAVGGFAQLQDARALFFGQPNVPLVQTNLVDVERSRRKAVAAAAPAAREAGVAAARQIGLRYSIQRRLANGRRAAVIPNEVLEAGDQVTLNVEPNEAGYLSVFERAAGAWRELSSSRVERLTSYTVPARSSLAFDPSGTIELFIVFSREARQAPYPVPEARLDQVISVNLQERLTYVVSTASLAEGQTVAFPITLMHK